MFSSEPYLLLHEGAGLVERRNRGQLLFSGADRRDFLQGLLTNDVQALQPGSGCYAALLTANGRMIADMRVFELGDSTLMDVDSQAAAVLRDRFDQSIFSEDVQVEDVSSRYRVLGVYGPSASSVVAAALTMDGASGALGLEAMPLYSNRRLETSDGSVIVVRSDEVGVEGFDLFVEESQSPEGLVDRLRASGALEVDDEAAEATRIEAGRPKFGVDMDSETIPLEAGIQDRAISLTKGCYVGQEIIIRVLHRGHGRVAKRLVGLTLDPSSDLPRNGDAVQSGDRQIGAVTSATRSPALGRPIAMGYVHRDFTTPGTEVAVLTAGGSQPAVVTGLPIVPTQTSPAGLESPALHRP
jgi:folate-binding protein YgfZ